MTTVCKWQIYCNTDNKWEYIWSETAPTVCPSNGGHSVNPSSVAIVEEISSSVVSIREETTPTGGHFASETRQLTIPAQTTQSAIYTWPFPISVLEVAFVAETQHFGDEPFLEVAPDTIIGAITADVSATDTVLDVQQTVIDNLDLGYWVTITDGVNVDDLGRVISIDKTNNKITIETPAVNSFLASSPTYVKMTVKMIHTYKIGFAQKYVIGESKIGGTYLPANTPVQVSYKNNHATDTKIFCVQIEYLY